MDISSSIYKYCIVSRKMNEKFGNVMWVLWGGNIAKLLHALHKRPMKNLGGWCGYYEVKTSYNAIWITNMQLLDV